MTGDALLVGRLTFEAFRSYWPQLTTRPVSTTAGTVSKVRHLGRSRRPGGREGTTVLRGDSVNAVPALKGRRAETS